MDLVMAQYFPAAGQGIQIEVLQNMFSECGHCQTKMALKRDPPMPFLNRSVCQHTLALPTSKDNDITFDTKQEK